MANQVLAYLDSSQREGGSNSASDFMYQLNLPKNQSFKRIAVTRATFPKQYYMIDSTNNTFIVTVAGTPYTATIALADPNGRNYSTNELAVAVKTALDASGSGNVYTITFNTGLQTQTGRFTITADTSDFVLSSANDSIARYLGISDGVSDTLVYVSDHIANLQRYDSLYLRSSMCTNGTDNILQEFIVRDTADFDVYNVSPSPLNWKVVRNGESNLQNFVITDINGKAVNLNGGNVQLTLVLDRFDSNEVSVTNLGK